MKLHKIIWGLGKIVCDYVNYAYAKCTLIEFEMIGTICSQYENLLCTKLQGIQGPMTQYMDILYRTRREISLEQIRILRPRTLSGVKRKEVNI